MNTDIPGHWLIWLGQWQWEWQWYTPRHTHISPGVTLTWTWGYATKETTEIQGLKHSQGTQGGVVCFLQQLISLQTHVCLHHYGIESSVLSTSASQETKEVWSSTYTQWEPETSERWDDPQNCPRTCAWFHQVQHTIQLCLVLRIVPLQSHQWGCPSISLRWRPWTASLWSWRAEHQLGLSGDLSLLATSELRDIYTFDWMVALIDKAEGEPSVMVSITLCVQPFNSPCMFCTSKTEKLVECLSICLWVQEEILGWHEPWN